MNRFERIMLIIVKIIFATLPFAFFINFLLRLESYYLNELMANAVATIFISIYCCTIIIIAKIDELEGKQ